MAEFPDFCDVFITINSHILKWKFSRGLTREICKNKTNPKITMYTVVETTNNYLYFASVLERCTLV